MSLIFIKCSPGKNTGMVAIPFCRDLPSPGFKPWSPALEAEAYHPSHPGSPE